MNASLRTKLQPNYPAKSYFFISFESTYTVTTHIQNIQACRDIYRGPLKNSMVLDDLWSNLEPSFLPEHAHIETYAF